MTTDENAVIRAACEAYWNGRLNTAELDALRRAVAEYLGARALEIAPEMFGGKGAEAQ